MSSNSPVLNLALMSVIQRFLCFAERWLFSTITNTWYTLFVICYGAGLLGLSLSVICVWN